MGEHTFRYDLVVHDGDWRTGATEAAAADLNEPLRAVPVGVHPGRGRARAFLTLEGDGVDLGALKVAEDAEDEIVVRLVERHGRSATATLSLPWPFAWRPADLIERADEAAGWTPSDGNQTTLRLAPWEIITLLVRRR